MSDSGANIGADLAAAIAASLHLDPSTYFQVQRRCLALIRAGNSASISLFLAASLAEVIAKRLDDGEGIGQSEAASWRNIGEALANALELGLVDPNQAVWAQLIASLYPLEAKH